MPLPDNTNERSCTIKSYEIHSDCRNYRYFLSRTWNIYRPVLMFIMLNPSKATVLKSDMTVTLCTNRAVTDGYGGIWVLNIFAYMATDKGELGQVETPIGLRNDEIIRQKVGQISAMDKIVCAWGGDGRLKGRGNAVKRILRESTNLPLYHLDQPDLPREKHPKHPRPVLNSKNTKNQAFQRWTAMD